MSERLRNFLPGMIDSLDVDEALKEIYRQRVERGRLTRQEDPRSHFAVFFMAYDPDMGLVYVGFHKKANQWIPNGGHIEGDELPHETVNREVHEEWGRRVNITAATSPFAISFTPIKNRWQSCKEHFDIWYILRTSSTKFDPDKVQMLREFYEANWKTLSEAQRIIVHVPTLGVLEKLARSTFKEP